MADNIAVKDATGTTVVMRATDNASVYTAHHIVDSSALPTGAATETTLASIDTKVATQTTLAAIETLLGSPLAVTGPLTDTQLRATAVPVSAASLPLPTGAATETTLASALTALQVIDNIVSGSGANISQMNGVAVTMGNGASGTGVQRVTIASDSTGVLNVGGRAAHDAAVSGNPVLVAGFASAAAPAAVSADGDVVRAWFLRNGAAATVLTAAGALIGGDATNGLDVDVTRAVLPVATSGGAANVSSSATNVTLLASNTSRKGFSIMNDSTAILYVKFGATASATSFHVKMQPGTYFESGAGFNYTGIIDGIWASANGSARMGEFT